MLHCRLLNCHYSTPRAPLYWCVVTCWMRCFRETFCVKQPRDGGYGLVTSAGYRSMPETVSGIWVFISYPATFEAGGRDATSQCLLGLVGLGIPGTAEQVATPVSRFLALLGTMRLPTRNAEGIRALVSLLAPNTRAIITEPDPVKVHIDNRSGLGAGNRIRLSQRATLGKTGREACSRVLVTLVTEDPGEAEGWLPGGILHTDLLVLLRVYLGYRSGARLRLTVPVRLLPEPRLGKGRRIQLGRTGLLGLKEGKLSNDRETLTVSLGRYEGLQCSAFSPAEDGHYRFD